MKRLMIVKTHPSMHVAHMYEHLFCMEIKRLMNGRSLYKYVDYAMQGTTYHESGAVEIDLELYTTAAEAAIDELLALRVPTNDKAIDIAYLQLVAEYEGAMRVSAIENVRDGLKELNDTPWTDVDELDTIDHTTYPRRRKPLWLDRSKHLRHTMIITTLALPPSFMAENRELAGLFWHMTRLIAYTVQDQLSTKYGYYGELTEFKNTRQRGARMEFGVSVANGHSDDVDIRHHAEEIKGIIEDITEHQVWNRQIDWLRTARLSTDPFSSPNPEGAATVTGIYYGAKAWQRLATMENVETILDAVHGEIRHKSTKHDFTLR